MASAVSIQAAVLSGAGTPVYQSRQSSPSAAAARERRLVPARERLERRVPARERDRLDETPFARARR